METLQKQIRVARRRLVLQQFVQVLAWCWFGSLLIATLGIAASKLWPVGVDSWTWSVSWIGGALAAGTIAAGIWTAVGRKSRFDAAVEIDRRFGLKERVSSSLALTPTEMETEAGQALVSDAIKRIDRIQVSEGFKLRLDRRALLPLVPAAAAFALAMFVDSKGIDNPAKATTTEAEVKIQVKKSAEVLRKKLEERKREAREKGLLDAEGLFKKLEEGTKSLTDKDDVERKQALVKLNDLAKDLEKRRQNIAGEDKFKQQLNQLKDIQHGPADKVAQALKNGDFQKAVNELDKLKKELARGDLDEKAKQDLAEQLEQMKQALDKARQAHEQAKQDLQREIEQKRQAGDTQGAEKAQQQLDRLSQQDNRMSKLGQMSDKLGKAAESMKQGKMQDAASALDQLSEDLAGLQKEADELQLLDDALDQIAQAKNSMKCDDCGGEGCKACQGGNGPGKKNGPPGDGLGAGRGQGDRPEEKNKTGFYDSNVKQNVGRGAAVITDTVEGPNRKGQVQEQIKAEFESAKKETADPLTGQRLPRDYREHAKRYFDALREGKKSE